MSHRGDKQSYYFTFYILNRGPHDSIFPTSNVEIEKMKGWVFGEGDLNYKNLTDPQKDRYKEVLSATLHTEKGVDPVIVVINERIKNLLEARLKDVQTWSKEVPGFRKGHDPRKFALRKILNYLEEHYSDNTKLINLEGVEKKVYNQLLPHDQPKFELGTQKESSKNKDKLSRYQLLKDQCLGYLDIEPERKTAKIASRPKK